MLYYHPSPTIILYSRGSLQVHFPNEKLIAEYDLQKVYILRDTPDLKRNMDFIKTLHPHTGLEIFYNIDMTAMGRESFDMLTHVVERKNVKFLGFRKNLHKSPITRSYGK